MVGAVAFHPARLTRANSAARRPARSEPIPWRLAVPSTKEFLMVLIGTITLIGSSVVALLLHDDPTPPPGVGPDPNALFRIRDRYAAPAEGLVFRAVGVFLQMYTISAPLLSKNTAFAARSSDRTAERRMKSEFSPADLDHGRNLPRAEVGPPEWSGCP
jgi:hypothetical protein